MKASVLDKVKADFNVDRKDRSVLAAAFVIPCLTSVQMRTTCLECGQGQPDRLGRPRHQGQGRRLVRVRCCIDAA